MFTVHQHRHKALRIDGAKRRLALFVITQMYRDGFIRQVFQVERDAYAVRGGRAPKIVEFHGFPC
jgi:hypothetical protein